LNREFGKRFGDDAYAVEELVAEMTAAFVCATLGFPAETRDDHADYLANWIKVLKADKRAIFTASTAAKKATEFLNDKAGFVPALDVDGRRRHRRNEGSRLMLSTHGRYTCDAEMGRPGAWKGCRRRAVVARDAELVTVHYCGKHSDRAHNPKPEHFKPKPGSEPYLLAAQ
jgi:hypothetical protein